MVTPHWWLRHPRTHQMVNELTARVLNGNYTAFTAQTVVTVRPAADIHGGGGQALLF